MTHPDTKPEALDTEQLREIASAVSYSNAECMAASRALHDAADAIESLRTKLQEQALQSLSTMGQDDATIADLRAQLAEARESMEYRKEQAAQREQRLWQWAHEELSEPLKMRYFNIVANGTADVMEPPVYAQQFNMMKYRAERAESERDAARAEAEALRADAERWRKLSSAMASSDPVEVQTPMPTALEAFMRIQAENKARADALIAQGKCPDCEGDGQMGGQFCGGYWTCETCNGTGTAMGAKEA